MIACGCSAPWADLLPVVGQDRLLDTALVCVEVPRVEVPKRRRSLEQAMETLLRSSLRNLRPRCRCVWWCPRCGSTSLSVVSTGRRTVVDVSEPLSYTVEEHVVNVYRCSGCGADNLAPGSAEGRYPRRPWRRTWRGSVRTGTRTSSQTTGSNSAGTPP
ncbi:MAG: IS66 family transposase zinc-finger binding domain-containing protein [Nitrososphaerota archaeon]|nr:IS66 family transposase zinc-finger binding domain-containing protein [Nitrososphaerota archaeon]